MPNTKSAEKRLRQNQARRTRNRAVKSEIKTRYRKVVEALEATTPAEQLTQMVREAAKRFDQAAAKGIIHRNAASRLKSRLVARVKKAAAKA